MLGELTDLIDTSSLQQVYIVNDDEIPYVSNTSPSRILPYIDITQVECQLNILEWDIENATNLNWIIACYYNESPTEIKILLSGPNVFLWDCACTRALVKHKEHLRNISNTTRGIVKGAVGAGANVNVSGDFADMGRSFLYPNSPFSLVSQAQALDSGNYDVKLIKSNILGSDRYEVKNLITNKIYNFNRVGGLYAYIGSDFALPYDEINDIHAYASISNNIQDESEDISSLWGRNTSNSISTSKPDNLVDNTILNIYCALTLDDTSLTIIPPLNEKTPEDFFNPPSLEGNKSETYLNPGNLSDYAMKRVELTERLHRSMAHGKKQALNDVVEYYTQTTQKSQMSKITKIDVSNWDKVRVNCNHCPAGDMTKDENISGTMRPDKIGTVAVDIIPVNHTKTNWLFLTTDWKCRKIFSYGTERKTEKVLCKDAVALLMHDYKASGHKVTVLTTDRESVLASISQEGILIIQSAPEQHENRAERLVRYMMDKSMQIFHTLDHSVNYEFLYNMLWVWVGNVHDMIPFRDDNNKLVTPFKLFYGHDASMNLMERFFGEYVMALNKNRKSKYEYKCVPGIIVAMDVTSINTFLVYLVMENKYVWSSKFQPITDANIIIKMNAALNDTKRTFTEFFPKDILRDGKVANEKKRKHIDADVEHDTNLQLPIDINIPITEAMSKIKTVCPVINTPLNDLKPLESPDVDKSNMAKLPVQTPIAQAIAKTTDKSPNDGTESEGPKKKPKNDIATNATQKNATSKTDELLNKGRANYKELLANRPMSELNHNTSMNTRSRNRNPDPTKIPKVGDVNKDKVMSMPTPVAHKGLQSNVAYDIQELLCKQRINKTMVYLVKWKGYDQSYNSWEPQKLLTDANYSMETLNAVPSKDKYEHMDKINICLAFMNEAATRLKNSPNAHCYMSNVTDNISFPIEIVQGDMSVKEAMRIDEAGAYEALIREVSILIQTSTCDGVMPKTLTFEQRKKVIPSFMFMKQKLQMDGALEKWKARFVAGGHRQHSSSYGIDDTSSTIHAASVKTLLSIAAYTDSDFAVIDITGAYLWALLNTEKYGHIHMLVPSEVAKVFVHLKPEFAKFLMPDGTMYVSLNKSLYGLKNSAFNFYQLLKEKLQNFGYEALPETIDSCVFRKLMNPDETHKEQWYSIIGVHVDDLGIVSSTKEILALKKHLEDCFGGTVKFQTGDNTIWLGLSIERDRINKSISVSQPLYINSTLAKKFNPNDDEIPITNTPADSALFDFDDTNTTGELDLEFISLLMSLAFLGNMSRPDLLTSLSALATRVTKTTQSDYAKLHRIWRYAYTTKNIKLVLQPINLIIHGVSDASYGGNSDRTSQSGMIISLGHDESTNNLTASVYCSSKKQKIVVTSSCEAELVTQAETLKYVLWLRMLMEHLGFPQEPSVIHQDNMSAITMAKKGKGNFAKSKHVDIRFFFINQYYQQGIIDLKYVPTKLMVADILTKSLQGKLFRSLRSNMLNNPEMEELITACFNMFIRM